MDCNDDFDKNAIGRTVRQIFFKNEIPAMGSVLEVIKSDGDLPNLKRTSFYELPKKQNFRVHGRNSLLLDEE